MNRKGQAAMEFLMTYGWAILAAIIAIGVLAYFGVFSPGKYTTGQTLVTAPFYAQASNVQVDYDDVTAGAQPGVILELKNNGGEALTVQSVEIDTCGTYSTVTPTAAGSATVFTIPCAAALTLGDNFRGDITIRYLKSGSTVDLISSGTIVDKVVA